VDKLGHNDFDSQVYVCTLLVHIFHFRTECISTWKRKIMFPYQSCSGTLQETHLSER